MRIPSRNLAGWSSEIVEQCTLGRQDRIMAGQYFRNLYLTGSEDGEPQTYNKCYDHIEDVAAFLCAPTDLRFSLNMGRGASPQDRAKAVAAASDLNSRVRRSMTHMAINAAVKWSLIKGNAFLKLGWSVKGLRATLIQPEFMGVLQPDVNGLDEQEVFVHSTYMTFDSLQRLVSNRSDRDDILKRVQKYITSDSGPTSPENQALLKQVVAGGFQSYTGVGGIGTPQTQQSRGIADWLGGPQPVLHPTVSAKMVRLDELWIKDDDRAAPDGAPEWTTVQIIGSDVVLLGDKQHLNAFADMLDQDDKQRIREADPDNPLAGHDPFVEFNPNPLEGYFWGRPEMMTITLAQKSINSRVDGVNGMLRRQEDPPTLFRSGTSINQDKYSKFKKPGGYLTDPDPNAREPTVLAPQIPQGLYDQIHEAERWIEESGGFSDVLKGRGTAGVRAMGHADTLTRNASPRFRNRAMIVETSVEQVGGLALDILKAKVITPLTAWVMPGDADVESAAPPFDPTAAGPAKSMKPIEFLYSDLGDDAAVVVDSHSGSPAFKADNDAGATELFRAGAMSPVALIEALHPANEEKLVAEAEQREIAQAEFAAKHPELAAKSAKKHK